MTRQDALNGPWGLYFDRDGTEDFGIICDTDGKDLVASHLPGMKGGRTFETGTFWLPENAGDEMPTLVRQMQAMTAAPKLLAMLEVAVATSDPAKHRWVEEARDAIAEATGQEAPGGEGADHPRNLFKAAPTLHAALTACEAVLEDCLELAKAVAVLLPRKEDDLPGRIEQARREALAARREAA